ncbi:MAG: hypothetical protein WD249_03865 [Gaiellaceae bacterium]
MAVASVVSANGRGAAGFVDASRVIDRTVLCEIGVQGGVRVATIKAASAIPSVDRYANVELGGGVRPAWRLAYLGGGEVALSPACTRSSSRVPLTTRGLSGGAADRFGDEHDCWTPRRVLLRVRGVFRSPVALRLGRPYGFPLLFARGTVLEAEFAIRTQSGRPIAYASVSRETGKARVFTTSRDCFPD